MTRHGRAPARRPIGRFACRLTAVAALIALSAVLALPGAPARAQQGGAAVPEGRIRLTVTELTGVLGPGSLPAPAEDLPVRPAAPDELRLRMLVENAGDASVGSLRTVVEIHPPALTRGTLRAALEGSLSTDPISVHVSPELDGGEALAPGEVTGASDAFTAGEVEWADGVGGVHPVKIAVMRGTETLDEVVTAVAWLGSTPSEPLLTTLVWPLDTAPWRSTDGHYPDAAGREIRPGGRLDGLIAAAEASDGTPLVLAPSAHLLEDLDDRSDGFGALVRKEGGSVEIQEVTAQESEAALARRTLQRIRELADAQIHAPVSGTYADADLAAIALAGNSQVRDLAGTAAVEGRRRLQLRLDEPVDAAVHLVDGPISPSVLDLLPGDALLLPSDAVEIPEIGNDPSLDEPVRVLRAPSGRLLTGLVADPYLEDALSATGHHAGPLVTAQRVIAESAMAHLVAPGVADRGLVLLPPSTWDPSPRTATTLLHALRDASWIELTSPARVAAEARPSSRPLELAPPPGGAFRSELTTALAAAATGLDSLEAALPDPGARLRGRSIEALEDDLLRATSRWYRRGTLGESDALVRAVQRAIDSTLDDIDVSSGTVTLTSDTGQIPVTLHREQGEPVQVVVSVQSQGRLLWPEGQESEVLTLTEGMSQTVSFPTRALSTGTFPVTVRVMDPSGTTTVASTTLSVRSTAISGAALAGTGILVGLLLLVGAHRRRERTPPALEVVDHR